MCGDKKSELELELEAIISGSAPPAAWKGKKQARVRSGAPGVAAGKRKLSPWTGVRPRRSGNWSTEIRAPRTREKLWIGTFSSPRQAALAYDAAVFCLFGERTPKSRKLNFPAAPRPEISETARQKLSVAEIKAIAEKHARAVDALLPPLTDEDTTAAAPADDLVVAPATTPPVAVDNAPWTCACARRAARLYWEGDELYQTTAKDFSLEAFEAELEAATFRARRGY